MDAASKQLPGSSQMSKLMLKLNTASEDWGDCQARGAKNMDTLPLMPLGWVYHFITK